MVWKIQGSPLCPCERIMGCGFPLLSERMSSFPHISLLGPANNQSPEPDPFFQKRKKENSFKKAFSMTLGPVTKLTTTSSPLPIRCLHHITLPSEDNAFFIVVQVSELINKNVLRTDNFFLKIKKLICKLHTYCTASAPWPSMRISILPDYSEHRFVSCTTAFVSIHALWQNVSFQQCWIIMV